MPVGRSSSRQQHGNEEQQRAPRIHGSQRDREPRTISQILQPQERNAQQQPSDDRRAHSDRPAGVERCDERRGGNRNVMHPPERRDQNGQQNEARPGHVEISRGDDAPGRHEREHTASRDPRDREPRRPDQKRRRLRLALQRRRERSRQEAAQRSVERVLLPPDQPQHRKPRRVAGEAERKKTDDQCRRDSRGHREE